MAQLIAYGSQWKPKMFATVISRSSLAFCFSKAPENWFLFPVLCGLTSGRVFTPGTVSDGKP